MKRKDYVQQQAQINTDETSWEKNNKRQWLWTAATELGDHLSRIVATRGADGFKQLVGTEFDGIIGSDRWSAYNWLDAAPVANSAGRIFCAIFKPS